MARRKRDCGNQDVVNNFLKAVFKENAELAVAALEVIEDFEHENAVLERMVALMADTIVWYRALQNINRLTHGETIQRYRTRAEAVLKGEADV